MTLVAITDLAALPDDLAPRVEVAGLRLIDRVARMCLVSGVSDVIVLLDARWPEAFIDEAISPGTRARGAVHLVTPDDAPALLQSLKAKAALLVPAQRVFQRAVVQQALKRCAGLSPGEVWRAPEHQTFGAAPGEDEDWPQALTRLRTQTPPIDQTSGQDAHTAAGWSVSLATSADIPRAETRLFDDCRKPQDGIVSRYINRHFSLAMSRALVSTPVGPNHISTITFSLGFASAIAAGWGGYAGFLLAGVLYQLNSVIDGVDGELARVRYEFSILGEWLDTVSDDLSDLLLYLGLGVGAWRTVEFGLGPLGPEIWLYLGLAAAAGKLASMIVYYRWLIARGRGDLLAFEWSFKSEDASPASPLKRLLSLVHYAFRKDFIVFVAMLMAIMGALPYLLVALAPGNVIVALSVVLQQLRANNA